MLVIASSLHIIAREWRSMAEEMRKKILDKELPVSAMKKLMSLLKEERVGLERQLVMFKSCQLNKMMQYAAELSTRRLADINLLLSVYASDSETESHTSKFEYQTPERLVEFQDV